MRLSRAGFVAVCVYFVDRKAIPTVNNLANQLRGRARARVIVRVCHVFAGFGCMFAGLTFRRGDLM